MYKLYTFFDGCNASVLPLQHFTFVLKRIVLTTMKRMLYRMLRSIKFAANAENIRTSEQKKLRLYQPLSAENISNISLHKKHKRPLRGWPRTNVRVAKET